MGRASGQACSAGQWEQGRKERCHGCKFTPGCHGWARTEFLLYPHSFISFSNPLPDAPYLWPSTKASSAPILEALERVCASHSLSRVELLAVSLMVFLASLLLFFTPAYSWCRLTLTLFACSLFTPAYFLCRFTFLVRFFTILLSWLCTFYVFHKSLL